MHASSKGGGKGGKSKDAFLDFVRQYKAAKRQRLAEEAPTQVAESGLGCQARSERDSPMKLEAGMNEEAATTTNCPPPPIPSAATMDDGAIRRMVDAVNHETQQSSIAENSLVPREEVMTHVDAASSALVKAAASPPKVKTKEYWALMKQFQRAKTKVPEEILTSLGSGRVAAGSLFKAWVSAGAGAAPADWADTLLEERVRNTQSQEVMDVHEFLCEAQLRVLPRFVGQEAKLQEHMNRCRQHGLWRSSPEAPGDPTLDEYYTRVQTKAIEKTSATQSTEARINVDIQRPSEVTQILAPTGALGALPEVAGVGPRSQGMLWGPSHSSGDPTLAIAVPGMRGAVAAPQAKPKAKGKAKAKAKAQAARDDPDFSSLTPATVLLESVKFYNMVSKEMAKQKAATQQGQDLGLQGATMDRLAVASTELERKAGQLMELVRAGSTEVQAYQALMRACRPLLAEGKILAGSVMAQAKAALKAAKALKSGGGQ